MQYLKLWLLSNIFLAIAIFSGITALCPKDLAAAPVEDVRTAFHLAKQEFDRRNFSKAKQQFLAIIKKYPDHEPSLIHLGKINFAEKNYAEAHKNFRKVNPLGQDPETSYEMGLVFINRGHLQEGINVLKTVPSGHQQYDIANFYAGRSALRLKQYTPARDFFKNATILPDTLAEQRRLYMEHISRVLQMREQTLLRKDLETEKQRLEQSPSAKAFQPLDQAKKKTPTLETRPIVKTAPMTSLEAWEREIYAFKQNTNVYIAREHQELSFEIGDRKRFDVDITGIQIHVGPDYKFHRLDDGRTGRVAMEIDLQADQRVRRGRHERLIGIEDDADLEFFVSDDPTVKREQYGRIHLQPFFEYPLLDDFLFGVHAQYSYVFPNFDKSKGAGTRGMGTELKYWVSDLELSGAFDFKEALDQEDHRYFNVFHTAFEGRWSFGHGLWVGGLVDYEAYEYFKAYLDGPDQLLGLYALLGWILPNNFELGGRIGFLQYQNYIYHGVDKLKEIPADATNYNGSVFFKARPIPFLAFEAEYIFSDTVWQQQSQDQDERVEFRANVPVNASQLMMKGMLVFDF